MSRISVQLYSVRDEFAADPSATLRRLAGIGFTQVEPYGLVQNLAPLRDALAEHGLTAPTAHAKIIGVDQREVFAAAAQLGIGVVIEPAVAAEHWQSPADIAATAAALGAAAKVAADHGVRVGYHNHWWELVSRIDGRSALEVFADQFDSEPGPSAPDGGSGAPLVLEVDTYWATAGGEDAPALLNRLGDRVHAIHVKDGDLAIDASGQVPAGQGQVPVADVLAAAPQALRVVEFDRYDGAIFEGLAASFRYLEEAER